MNFGNNPTVNYDMNSPVLFPPRAEQPFMPPVKNKPFDILTNGAQTPLDQLSNGRQATPGSKKFGSYIGQ